MSGPGSVGDWRRWWGRCGLLVVCLLGATGCGWLPTPATEQARDLRRLWGWYASAAAVVGGLVVTLIVFSAVRYRRRPGERELPRQLLHNVRLEIGYIVAPLFLIAVLVAGALAVTQRVDRIAPDPDVTVEVVAYRWQWQFTYAGEGVTLTGTDGDEPELVLPAPARIRFTGTSTDVIHALWVPHFLFKRDLIPGRVTTFEVDTAEPGVYAGQCAEFCGLNHAWMSFRVRIVSPDEYAAWLDGQRTAASPTSTGGAG